jgi:hypothetical protein
LSNFPYPLARHLQLTQPKQPKFDGPMLGMCRRVSEAQRTSCPTARYKGRRYRAGVEPANCQLLAINSPDQHWAIPAVNKHKACIVLVLSSARASNMPLHCQRYTVLRPVKCHATATCRPPINVITSFLLYEWKIFLLKQLNKNQTTT